MKNFALIGAAGYIAPRHMKAIKDTGNNLVVALDSSDSVGIIDSYFPEADFFTEYERFDRHIEKLRRTSPEKKVDYVSICSPNYLHDSHIRFALRVDADAICEKPLVLNPWNIDALQKVEEEYQKKINTILQLRLHPSIIELKERVEKEKDKVYDIDLSYITSRGKWYNYSWKGNIPKSGGIATNIGIHFFDMLCWIFGPVEKNVVHLLNEQKGAGFLQLKRANVKWFLSIDKNDLPKTVKEAGTPTFRSIKIGEELFEFSTGFKELHTASYQNILEGKGFGLLDSFDAVKIVYDIRNGEISGLKDDYHHYLFGLK